MEEQFKRRQIPDGYFRLDHGSLEHDWTDDSQCKWWMVGQFPQRRNLGGICDDSCILIRNVAF
jgi:hypothetical protein